MMAMTPRERISAEWGVIEQHLLDEVTRRRQQFEQAKRALDRITEELQVSALDSCGRPATLDDAARRYERAFNQYRNALHTFSAFILDGRTPLKAAASDPDSRMSEASQTLRAE